MNRGNKANTVAENYPTTLSGDLESASKQRLCRRGTHTNNDFGADDADFFLKPRTASGDFDCVRLLMNAAFAPGFPFEMLHYICNVNIVAFNARGLKGLIEQLPCWSHKWTSLEIFLIARLFAY